LIKNQLKKPTTQINELITWSPHKKEIFKGYLKSQEFENNMLENELVTGTWLLKLKI
jgi:hypothetical protein